MNNNHNFKPLQDDETAIALPSSMFKHKELLKFIHEAFRIAGLNRLSEMIWDQGRGRVPIDRHEENRKAWFSDGIKCEVLKPNSNGWEKGKFRINISIEFCPETLETKNSDLDSIRQN
jgi:KGK domain